MENVTYEGGQGYFAEAERDYGAVIVIQEWWGLVGHITDVCDRLAEAGYHALAPDLYEGKTTEEPDEAGSLMMALNIAETEQRLRAATTYLLSESGKSRAGVVGFCMGGQLALFAACEDPRIAACINFYGVHPAVQPRLELLQAPVLGLFAENDPWTGPEVVAALEAQLKDLGKDHEFETYPGVGHAFFNDERPAYNAQAAADAWKRVLMFFDTHLE